MSHRHRLGGLLVALLLLPAVFAGSAGAAPTRPTPVPANHGHGHGHGDPFADQPGKHHIYTEPIETDGQPEVAGLPVAPTQFSVDVAEPWQPCEYDNLAPTTDQTDLTTLPAVHFAYVYPSDVTSVFGTYDAAFQADMRKGSRIMRSVGRDVRLDWRNGQSGFRSCLDNSKQVLDITVFQSQYTTAELAAGEVFSLVADEMIASGKFSNPNKKYLAYVDYVHPTACGLGNIWHDPVRAATNLTDVNRTFAMIFKPYEPDAASGGWCRTRGALHEIGHMLGALQTEAPNAYDGVHCDDDNNDVMCYKNRALDQITSPDPQFDYAKNDYWDPGASSISTANPDGVPTTADEKLPWWTVNLSKYICPLGTGGLPNCALPNTAPGY